MCATLLSIFNYFSKSKQWHKNFDDGGQKFFISIPRNFHSTQDHGQSMEASMNNEDLVGPMPLCFSTNAWFCCLSIYIYNSHSKALSFAQVFFPLWFPLEFILSCSVLRFYCCFIFLFCYECTARLYMRCWYGSCWWFICFLN